MPRIWNCERRKNPEKAPDVKSQWKSDNRSLLNSEKTVSVKPQLKCNTRPPNWKPKKASSVEPESTSKTQSPPWKMPNKPKRAKKNCEDVYIDYYETLNLHHRIPRSLLFHAYRTFKANIVLENCTDDFLDEQIEEEEAFEFLLKPAKRIEFDIRRREVNRYVAYLRGIEEWDIEEELEQARQLRIWSIRNHDISVSTYFKLLQQFRSEAEARLMPPPPPSPPPSLPPPLEPEKAATLNDGISRFQFMFNNKHPRHLTY